MSLEYFHPYFLVLRLAVISPCVPLCFKTHPVYSRSPPRPGLTYDTTSNSIPPPTPSLSPVRITSCPLVIEKGKTFKLDVNHLNHCIVIKNTVKILNKTCFVHKYLNPAELKNLS